MVTFEYMVARLVGPDSGGWKEAMTQTVKADLVDSDQSATVWWVAANLWCGCLIQVGNFSLLCQT